MGEGYVGWPGPWYHLKGTNSYQTCLGEVNSLRTRQVKIGGPPSTLHYHFLEYQSCVQIGNDNAVYRGSPILTHS